MTVEDLMEAYEGCISSLRKTQAARRTASLKRISPANFSKEVYLIIHQCCVYATICSINTILCSDFCIFVLLHWISFRL